MENLYLLHRSLHPLRFNPVANAIRFEEQDDQSAGEVLEVSGERHTDGHTRRCQQGGERRCVDAQRSDDRDDEQHGEQNLNEAPQKRLYALVDVLPVEHFCHDAVDERDEQFADDKDDCGDEDMSARRDAELKEFSDDEVNLVDVDIRLDSF